MRMAAATRILVLAAVLLACGAAVSFAATAPAESIPFSYDQLIRLTWPSALVATTWLLLWSPLGRVIAERVAARLGRADGAASAEVLTTLAQVGGALREVSATQKEIQKAQGEIVQAIARLQEDQSQTQLALAVLMERTR